MPQLSSNPLNESAAGRTLRKHPALFGLPFVIIVVAASFGLESLTQTRYDLHSRKVTQVSKEEQLGLNKSKRKFDVREEYYRLKSAPVEENWESKRIERPKGVPEWGVPPSEKN